MTRTVLLHTKAQKTFDRLPNTDTKRIRRPLRRIAEDPFGPRSGADIKKLKGTRGRVDLYRIRVGEFRAIYAATEDAVLVTDLFRRGEGYEI